MGFSISWVAFQKLSKLDVLQRCGLREVGVNDVVNRARFSFAEIPTGWVILFANDFDFGGPKHLIELSSGAVIISCQVEEHAMVSGSYCYSNGQEVWSIRHDSERGRYDLSISGILPPEFELIKTRLYALQADNDRAKGRVDYMFDVPVELAAKLTGYRHDQTRFDWGNPHFTVL
jgi:hypothetical protein